MSSIDGKVTDNQDFTVVLGMDLAKGDIYVFVN